MMAVPITLYATDNGPAEMDLKERFQVEGRKSSVIFPHHQHQAKLSCEKCHKDPAGGGDLVVEIINKTGTSNDFHKKFCWPCHKEMSVLKGTTCSTCHK